ncbi:MAG TPA: hypothetical protein VNW92_11935 [Polyangiaceae bacterium]|jgi:hypothetical protein|nr:hypothetical protein [Polyangiaceae bacterium]
MIVTPGTHINSSPEYATVYEDPNNQTPDLTAVTAIGNNTSFHGTYSTSTCTAVVYLTSTEYLDLYNKLNSGTVRIDLTYDSSVSGTTKPVMSAPTFTLV